VSAIIDPRFPKRWITDLFCEQGATPDEQVDVLAGECRDIANTYDMLHTGTVTCDLTVIGLNGRDVDGGGVQANEWYSLWLIARTDTGATGTLFSTATTEAGLTYPANYDVARRIGWVRTDGTADIIPFYQIRRQGLTRWWYYDQDVDGDGPLPGDTRIVNGGTQTAWSAAGSGGGGANYIPPTQIAAPDSSGSVMAAFEMEVIRTGSSSNYATDLRPAGTSFDNTWELQAGLAAGNDGNGFGNMHIVPINATRTYEYQLNSGSGGNTTISVIGWADAV
jgi:hypothetical protein